MHSNDVSHSLLLSKQDAGLVYLSNLDIDTKPCRRHRVFPREYLEFSLITATKHIFFIQSIKNSLSLHRSHHTSYNTRANTLVLYICCSCKFFLSALIFSHFFPEILLAIILNLILFVNLISYRYNEMLLH